jgi:hypothetical protein
MIDDEDQIEGLDVLRKEAFQDGNKASDIDQEHYKEEWWNELATATFPRQDVSLLLLTCNCQILTHFPVRISSTFSAKAVGTAPVRSGADPTGPR